MAKGSKHDLVGAPTGATRASLAYRPAAAALNDDPRSARFVFSPAYAKAIARQREQTLARFNALKKTHGVAKSAKMVGSSVVSLWRWQAAFAARGLPGLTPKPPSGGRKSPFAKLRLPESARRELERLAAASGSAKAAWLRFASSPDCPPLLARHIQTHGKAPALLAALARLTPVQAVCYLSADGRRLFIRLTGNSDGPVIHSVRI